MLKLLVPGVAAKGEILRRKDFTYISLLFNPFENFPIMKQCFKYKLIITYTQTFFS